MPANYVLLEKITVGAAGASSVTFSGIPQTGYTDLVVKASSRIASGNFPDVYISFNGSSANFTARNLFGSGSTAASDTVARLFGYGEGSSQTANTFTNGELYIPNYTSANNKSFSVDSVTENNATESYAHLIAGLWSQTAAITSITITPSSSTFAANSTFYLYGVAKLGTTPAIVPYATGGDTIMTDGTYWYHAFKSSGTFTPAKALSADVLVVAGGGSGASRGSRGGGGGGAGGLLAYSAQALAAAGYTVTIGAGGVSSGYSGNNGSNSQFGSLTASVGGGGGAYAGTGNTGGSGGGGDGTGNAGGAGTSGQGYAGGTGVGTNPYRAGGGGGAGSVGASGASSGNGGAGVNTYSTWLSATGLGVSGYIAGGGGGGADGLTPGTGGSGGGGNGSGYGGTPTSAPANTGSGGGGYNNDGLILGAGGSGLVIVRYAV